MSASVPQPDPAVVDALRLLGKRRLALAIHDGSFPATPGADIGRGSPYSAAAAAFLGFARGLGFDAVQFGPQGQTTRDNPSPYDATLFSRNLLNLDLQGLAGAGQGGAADGWLSRDTLRRLAQEAPAGGGSRAAHAYAFDAVHAALDEIYRNFAVRRAAGDAAALHLAARLAAFSERERDWLDADALYHVLAAEQNGRHHRDWPATDTACPERNLYHHAADRRVHCAARRRELSARRREPMERYRLGQFLLHRRHVAMRAEANRLGLRIYGDLQVGLSPCDEWSRGGYYLDAYRMGAPPSRTNPEGQPWGYGALDPEQYFDADGGAGPALRHVQARVAKVLSEFDGLRIDHPHGLVCPWVYRADTPDPIRAVQRGARLFSSPNLPDHPELARYAIADPEQIDSTVPRYLDHWVRSLRSDQVRRYAVLMDTVVDAARKHPRAASEVLCEVLSTLPYPLARVIERQGLGRFRVTQKADLDNPGDVYRSENARPEDWIMVGNHDTPPIWHLARRWSANGAIRQQAQYLAWRLAPESRREAFARALARDHRRLVHAKVADLFVSRAAHVMIFFADLLGMEAIYNRPGVSDPRNWTLRVPPDFVARYRAMAAEGAALNLPAALALALRARPGGDGRRDVIERLERSARWSIGW